MHRPRSFTASGRDATGEGNLLARRNAGAGDLTVRRARHADDRARPAVARPRLRRPRLTLPRVAPRFA